MPTRHIDRSPVKVTGRLPDGQQFESSLEEDFYALLSFNRDVERFETQPLKIPFTGPDDKRHTYTPDALVYYRPRPDGSPGPIVLCEVKPDVPQSGDVRRHRLPRRDDPQLEQAKWDAAQRHADRMNWGWKVYRESEIRTPYLRNVKFLRRTLERPAGEAGKAEILEALAQSGAASLGHLIDTLCVDHAQRGEFLPTWYRLIGTGEIAADLTQLLTAQTQLSLPSQALPSPTLPDAGTGAAAGVAP